MKGPKDISAQRPRRVTAQTVADAAGVSRSAVSRAFTDGAYLDAEKRKKVLQVAGDLGYQPNALAAGLQQGQSHLIAIFVGNMRNPYDTAFVGQLVRALNALNKWPVLIDGSGEQANSAVDKVLSYPLDALILRGGSMSAEIVKKCARLGVPMISSGRPVSGRRVDNVCCRNADGTAMATQLLLDCGRRRFGLLSGPTGLFSSNERRAGVICALKTARLSLVAEICGDYTVQGGLAAAHRLLENHQLDAVVCGNDATAIGALTAASERGLDVPEELSVVGFDDIDMASWPMFNLTTIRNPIEVSVTEIIGLLERRLRDPDKLDETIFVEPQLVARGTHQSASVRD